MSSSRIRMCPLRFGDTVKETPLHWFDRFIVWSLPAAPDDLVHRVAQRYIAGETLEEAIELVSHLRSLGDFATVDVLGEDIRDIAQADETVKTYLDTLKALAERAGPDPGEHRPNVSLKLTQFGLRLDAEICWANVRRILGYAREIGAFVRIDMEDATVTDATLAVYRRARDEGFRDVGCVLQAYLRRTADDVADLLAQQNAQGRLNVRLCKGIYRERPDVAFQDPDEIRESYMMHARTLVEGGAYVGLATHDLVLVERCRALVDELGAKRDDHEFQALKGVPVEETLHAIRDAGHRTRLYVPYGSHWYAYSLRRLRENPSVAGQVFKSILEGEV